MKDINFFFNILCGCRTLPCARRGGKPFNAFAVISGIKVSTPCDSSSMTLTLVGFLDFTHDHSIALRSISCPGRNALLSITRQWAKTLASKVERKRGRHLVDKSQNCAKNKKKERVAVVTNPLIFLPSLVGARGFEPPTPCSQGIFLLVQP